MAKPWYCLDCGHTGPRPHSLAPVTGLLLLPAVWTLWSALAPTLNPNLDLPVTAKFAAVQAFMLGIGKALLWLILPLVYRLVANRKRCALCGRNRIIPGDSPTAQAAAQARDNGEVERLRSEIRAETRGAVPARH